MVKRFRFGSLSLGSVRQWHWMSSAVCLLGMLLFAVTGITLNHAASIPSEPSMLVIEGELPTELLSTLADGEQSKRLPSELRDHLAVSHRLHLPTNAKVEWSDEEIYVALPRPGGDAWLSIDLTTREFFYERTDRGWVSYLNGLHKGRDTGLAWRLFIDGFAIACVVFCITGLVLLIRHAEHRLTTWPLVALGAVIPVILIILFVH